MPKAVFQVEKFNQGHVEKAVKLAQHLFGSLLQRKPLRRKFDENAAFIGFVPAGAFLVTAIAASAGVRWSLLGPGLAVAACAATAGIARTRLFSSPAPAAPVA